jgi:hypothetical protein
MGRTCPSVLLLFGGYLFWCRCLRIVGSVAGVLLGQMHAYCWVSCLRFVGSNACVLLGQLLAFCMFSCLRFWLRRCSMEQELGIIE